MALIVGLGGEAIGGNLYILLHFVPGLSFILLFSIGTADPDVYQAFNLQRTVWRRHAFMRVAIGVVLATVGLSFAAQFLTPWVWLNLIYALIATAVVYRRTRTWPKGGAQIRDRKLVRGSFQLKNTTLVKSTIINPIILVLMFWWIFLAVLMIIDQVFISFDHADHPKDYLTDYLVDGGAPYFGYIMLFSLQSSGLRQWIAFNKPRKTFAKITALATATSIVVAVVAAIVIDALTGAPGFIPTIENGLLVGLKMALCVLSLSGFQKKRWYTIIVPTLVVLFPGATGSEEEKLILIVIGAVIFLAQAFVVTPFNVRRFDPTTPTVAEQLSGVSSSKPL